MVKVGDLTIQDDADKLPAPKAIFATRDMTAATGDVAYTGVGFKPSSLTMTACINTDGGSRTFGVSVGSGTGASGDNFAMYLNATSTDPELSTGVCGRISQNGTTYQHAVLKSFDSDGFTITWTKAGAATGTGSIFFLLTK